MDMVSLYPEDWLNQLTCHYQVVIILHLPRSNDPIREYPPGQQPVKCKRGSPIAQYGRDFLHNSHPGGRALQLR